MAEEKEAAAFAGSLSCIEHLLLVHERTQAHLHQERVDVVGFQQLSEQLPAVGRDAEVGVNVLGRPLAGLKLRFLEQRERNC